MRVLSQSKAGQLINHRIEIHTLDSFFKDYLGINPITKITTLDWLTLSDQKLRTIRCGKIFHDQLGLKDIQKKLHYFPFSVWLYLLASEWMKISQEEPFVGRTGHVGDEVGSKIIASRLVQTIMGLCFLMEKEYAPYSKWYGTAFSRLPCAPKLSPLLNKVLNSNDWRQREENLSQVYTIIATMHNDLKITKTLPQKVSPFHDRPYLVIHGGIFAQEIKRRIQDPLLKKIPVLIGSVNQLSHTVDLLENDKLLKKLKVLYR